MQGDDKASKTKPCKSKEEVTKQKGTISETTQGYKTNSKSTNPSKQRILQMPLREQIHKL